MCRQALLLLFVAVLLAGTSIDLGHTAPVTQFGYDSFAARDELDFSVQFNPLFGPETLKLMSYDPLGGGERIEVGAVWYKQRVEVNSFAVTFTVRMSNLSNNSSGHADGFAFVVQNHKVNAFGAGAGGVGYGSTPDYNDLGVRRSVAVEFDTFWNEMLGDPNANHISVHHTTPQRPHNDASENATVSPPGAVTNIPAMAGATHKYKVQYIGKQLSVYIDDNAKPVYQASLDIAEIISLNATLGAFVGLTSSCAGTCEDVEVLDWHLNAANLSGVINPEKSEVLAATANGVAGQLMDVVVLAKDSLGDVIVNNDPPITFRMYLENASTVATSTFVGNGIHLIQYSLTTAGTRIMSVALEGTTQQVRGSPFLATIVPALPEAWASIVSGQGIVGGTAGSTLPVVVRLRDRFGNYITAGLPAGHRVVGFFHQPAAGAGVEFAPLQADGTYTGSYAITTPGLYHLTVRLEPSGQVLPGSPFLVTITAAAEPCVVASPRPIMAPVPTITANVQGTGPARLLSGGSWNSQSYASEQFPVWFEVDFKQDVFLAELQLKVDQAPAVAETVHTITGGLASNHTLARLAATTYHNQTIVVPINETVRVFRVTTTVTPSWVAWFSVLAVFTPN